MMEDSETSNISATLKPILDKYKRYSRMYQAYLDHSVPHVLHRWLGTAGLVAIFLLRIVIAQGWYIVCYAHAIYLLNLLLAFLQPKFDPSLEADLVADNIEEGGEELPTTRQDAADEEFRPFVRRLPEWDFWLAATKATVLSLFCTTSVIFDVPVYWPILLVYFCILFTITMKRQIKHMIKYKYIPFDFGKKKYGGR